MLSAKNKKWGKVFLIVVASCFIILFSIFLYFHEMKPSGTSGPEAEVLAQKMLSAIHHTEWQNTKAVSWSFPGGHQYFWDKRRHFVQVKWKDFEVLININDISGIAKKGGQKFENPDDNQDLVQKAWEMWVNDSFWLNAPAKILDPGTSRSIVTMEDGSQALMITYASGGVTPGDTYLWILDESFLPKAWKLWVKIIPIGGVQFTWEKWIETESGAKIAPFHHSDVFDLELTNIKTFTVYPTEDIFKELSK